MCFVRYKNQACNILPIHQEAKYYGAKTITAVKHPSREIKFINFTTAKLFIVHTVYCYIMGQSLSKKVLQRHMIEANKMEKILQHVFKDISLRLTVLTGKVLCDPLEVMADFVGSVKYLLIYNPANVDDSCIGGGSVDDSTGNMPIEEKETNVDGTIWRDVPSTNSPTASNGNRPLSQKQELKKKVLACKSFLLLRRLCYEYEHVMEIGSQSPTNATTISVSDERQLKAGGKRVDSYDPDECSICMDASIDIVLPCLHGEHNYMCLQNMYFVHSSALF